MECATPAVTVPTQKEMAATTARTSLPCATAIVLRTGCVSYEMAAWGSYLLILMFYLSFLFI